jgi:hypothetical protein
MATSQLTAAEALTPSLGRDHIDLSTPAFCADQPLTRSIVKVSPNRAGARWLKFIYVTHQKLT